MLRIKIIPMMRVSMSRLHSVFVGFVFCFIFVGCSEINPKLADTLTEKTEPQVVTAQGQSKIVDGALLQARTQAIQAAIHNASKQIKQGHSSSLVGNTKVVDEWQQEGIYQVQVLSVVSENEFCHSPYRKRIVATAFPAVKSGQISANESQDLYAGIPREINNLLMQSGDFIGTNKTTTLLYEKPNQAPELLPLDNYGGSYLQDLASESQSQFVLSGVIRSFAVENTEYVRGAGVLSQVKSAFRDVAARRGITLDVYVHDGYSSALLFQHRYSDTILGDVWIPNGYAVGSQRFQLTSAGNKITELIHMASQDIRRIFGCYPFTARILKVNKDHVVIAAGSRDKIQRGDSLVVYAADATSQQLGLADSHKTPIGMLKIESVNANYSVGKLEVPLNIRKIREGDWVKSW